MINKFDIINCVTLTNDDNAIITSDYECSRGINPRLTIGTYNAMKYEYNIFNYILNSPNKIKVHNPEIFLYDFYTKHKIYIIQSNMIKILRIRSNGLNENGIKIIDL